MAIVMPVSVRQDVQLVKLFAPNSTHFLCYSALVSAQQGWQKLQCTKFTSVVLCSVFSSVLLQGGLVAPEPIHLLHFFANIGIAGTTALL
jgi:hypothetical protein